MEILKRKLSSFQIILLGFAGVILLGALILTLPISSKSHEWTSFIDALFTSTSAVCVTGLVVFDTATHWTIFGQIIILLLIQIGGMGVVTIAVSLAVASGKKIGLFSRETMKNAISAPNVSGIVRLTGFIIKGIFLIEMIGALIMLPVFCKDYGAEGIWMAVFHSVSAFCNAGFDIMGTKSGEFTSLTHYSAQPVINITIMLLIIVGGIGFLVWEDICKHKWRIREYRTQSKLVLIVTAVLIVFPAVYFFFFECGDLPVGERILASLFQSVTPRTAGFNTVDPAAMTDGSKLLTLILMFIGGNPGSTAGGVKTTSAIALFLYVRSNIDRSYGINVFGRRLEEDAVKRAGAICTINLTAALAASILIMAIQPVGMADVLFETFSAIGTVGMTTGITRSLLPASRIVIILLMYCGRIGSMSFALAFTQQKRITHVQNPVETVSIG